MVGASGSGKSTIAKLIAGIHSPNTGRVHVGGAVASSSDGAGHGAGQKRRAVVLVTQESHVFTGTISDNLRLADPNATDVSLSDVLRKVGAHEWLEALPAGVETEVGVHGVQLTPAQAQQLALTACSLQIHLW